FLLLYYFPSPDAVVGMLTFSVSIRFLAGLLNFLLLYYFPSPDAVVGMLTSSVSIRFLAGLIKAEESARTKVLIYSILC
ncbi:MAG: hypothetical protein MH132_12275, partial [Hydrotalea sp.]|nr:hypothetical protein [Hydrotalea sp.]